MSTITDFVISTCYAVDLMDLLHNTICNLLVTEKKNYLTYNVPFKITPLVFRTFDTFLSTFTDDFYLYVNSFLITVRYIKRNMN